MKIRELHGSDTEDYYHLRLEALLTNPDAFITTYEEKKNQPDPIEQTRKRLEANISHTFGVFQDDQLLGVVTLRKESHLKSLHKANILTMYVSPRLRRQGAGESLLHEVIQFSRTIDLEILHLSVVKDNKPALELYKKVGLRSYGLERNAIKLTDYYLHKEHMELFIE